MSGWNQENVLGLARCFMECRIFLTGAELDLFTLLADAEQDAAEIAARLGAEPRALAILLDALSAMGLLVKTAGRYRCQAEAAPLLDRHSPASVLPMVLHAAQLWQRWSKLTEVVAGPETAARDDAERMRAFIGAMHVIGAPQAGRIVALVDPGPARRLLDVGGASGTYTLAFLRAAPALRATLFDRPEVVELARERLSAAGVTDRVTLMAGDFDVDPLPGGHDLAFVSAIIHQNSPAENVALFRNVYQALAGGGRVVVRDHVMEPDRLRPRSGAVFAVNMLAGTEGGGTYTFEEIRDALTRAGFTRVRLLHPDEHMDGLVEAFRS